MEILAKGQLSYLILSCLAEKDMYGLELIDEIKKHSGFEIKMPSLYSNINRMKELKFISSYLKESTKGPKCAYSSITENGRIELARLKEVFGELPTISEDVTQENIIESKTEIEEQNVADQVISTEEIINNSKKSEIRNAYDDYDDFFADIPEENQASKKVAIENSINAEEKSYINENIEEETIDEEKTKDVIDDSIDEEFENEEDNIKELETDNISEENEINSPVLADIPEEKPIENILQEIIPVENIEPLTTEIKNDAVFLSDDDRPTGMRDEYNQKLFDVSKDYNKYKKKKSFSENQIEMVVNSAAPVEARKERIAENVNEIKEALLQTRQGYYDEVKLPEAPVIEEKDEAESSEQETLAEEKVKDDGVFITDRVEFIPKTKRFEPPKLSLLLNTNDEMPLPAPKRNISLDPNCSDVKARIENLYSKSQTAVVKEEDSPKKRESGFENYEELKEYYDSQNVSFKVYKRAEKKASHNTNKIIFFVDLIMFGLIGLGSGLLYLLFSQLGLTNANTNFMYYLFPILYLVYLMVRLYMYKRVVSKVPRPLFNFIVIWGSAILISGIIFCLNLAGGMPINQILTCSTTIFIPIFMIIIIFIVRHYSMLFALKKYWK